MVMQHDIASLEMAQADHQAPNAPHSSVITGESRTDQLPGLRTLAS